MSIQKEQKMDMYLETVALYSTYVSCLARVVREFIENGDSNLKPTDVPNLVNLLAVYTNMLHLKIIKMKKSWEFDI